MFTQTTSALSRIHVKLERYCHKCHRIKHLKDFKKVLFSFKIAGVCKICEGKRR